LLDQCFLCISPCLAISIISGNFSLLSQPGINDTMTLSSATGREYQDRLAIVMHEPGISEQQATLKSPVPLGPHIDDPSVMTPKKA
jgi:hypothetical protein